MFQRVKSFFGRFRTLFASTTPLFVAQVNIDWSGWGDKVAAIGLDLLKGALVFFVHATSPLLVSVFLLGLVLASMPALHFSFKGWGAITTAVWIFVLIQFLGQLGYV